MKNDDFIFILLLFCETSPLLLEQRERKEGWPEGTEWS
ncbi:MAG: hypothetical protein RLY35_1859, partial [Bacteroidota bacterium]